MLQATDIVIRLNPADDVVIARVDVPNGTLLVKENVHANVLIPAGHKIATRDVGTGTAPARRVDPGSGLRATERPSRAGRRGVFRSAVRAID